MYNLSLYISVATLVVNMLPAFRNEHFISVFAVFFPAMTGMIAATNVVDKLSRPQRQMPIGLLSGIAASTFVYVVGIWMIGATVLRDASGLHSPVFDNISATWMPPECVHNFTCQYGLMNFFQVCVAIDFCETYLDCRNGECMRSADNGGHYRHDNQFDCNKSRYVADIVSGCRLSHL